MWSLTALVTVNDASKLINKDSRYQIVALVSFRAGMQLVESKKNLDQGWYPASFEPSKLRSMQPPTIFGNTVTAARTTKNMIQKCALTYSKSSSTSASGGSIESVVQGTAVEPIYVAVGRQATLQCRRIVKNSVARIRFGRALHIQVQANTLCSPQ